MIPDYQGVGLSKVLVHRALQHMFADADVHSMVYLTTQSDNMRAISMYWHRFGLVPIRRTGCDLDRHGWQVVAGLINCSELSEAYSQALEDSPAAEYRIVEIDDPMQV